MKSQNFNFRKPEIKRFKDKWYIEYYYRCPADLLDFGYKEWQRFKVYEDINRYKGDEKEEYAKRLCDATLHALEKENYNPFDDIREKLTIKNNANRMGVHYNENYILLKDAFTEFIKAKKSKKLSPNSINAYNSHINNFKFYLFDKGKENIPLSDFDGALIKEMLDWLNDKMEWSETSYNNGLAFVILLINWFAERPRNWIDKNNYHIGKDKDIEFKTAHVIKNQHFYGSVYDKVVEHLKKFPKLLFYSKFIYYSCMRPDEIRNLQIGNIDLKNRMIKIIGKTGYRIVPICDELEDMLLPMKLDTYPINYYVLGKAGEISNERHGENYYSKYFRERVKNKIGLGAEYTLYGWKHTRVIDLINAGFRDAEIMQLTGHRDTDSYDAYKRDLTGSLDSKIKGKTTTF